MMMNCRRGHSEHNINGVHCKAYTTLTLNLTLTLTLRPITAVPRNSLCPTSQQGSIFDPLLGVSWWFRDAGSAHLVHEPSLWPARRFGTLYQTA